MVDLKLKRIQIRGWMKFRQITVEFPEKGLLLVQGINTASGGALQSVGCHALGQKVLMHDGSLKPVETVAVDDTLMGPDSNQRKVLKLCRGTGNLYKICPVKGEPFVVNGEHVLSLFETPNSKRKAPRGDFHQVKKACETCGNMLILSSWNDIERKRYCSRACKSSATHQHRHIAGRYREITVNEFLKLPKYAQAELKLYSSGVSFPRCRLDIPPRILGMWLGDGSQKNLALTTTDPELLALWQSYAERIGCTITPQDITYTIDSGHFKRKLNAGYRRFEKYGLFEEKHIPRRFLRNSLKNRRELLAGLIDTDGSCDGAGFSYSTVSKRLAEDVAFLGRSLGFRVLAKKRKTKCQTGTICDSYRLSFTGNCAEIPTVLPRKKARARTQRKRHYVTGFKVKPAGFGNFYGFTLDKNGLYLLDDFTVTHNSGKTGLGEAISRTLLGVSGRFTTLKQFSTNKGGDLYVKLEAEFLGKPLIVESGYKCKEMSPNGEALRYTYDGQLIERGLIAQTRAELSKLLGVSPLLASWTAFIDGDNIKFNKLSQADSVELVMASLKQPPWSDYYEASKKALGQFRRNMAGSETTHAHAADSVRTLATDVDAAKRQFTLEHDKFEEAKRANDEQIKSYQRAVNKKTKQVDEAKIEMEGIEKKLKLMEDERAAASHKLEIKLHEIEDQLHKAEKDRQPFNIAREDAHEKVTLARTAHQNYASAAKECPTCKRPLGKIDEKHLALLADQLIKAKAHAEKANVAWTAAEQKMVSCNTQYREISKQHREVSAKQEVENLSDRHEELTDAINSALDEIHAYEVATAKLQSGPSDSAIKTAEGRLADRRAALIKAQAALDEAAQALAADQATLKILEYWNLAFSPYGIPNMVLRDAIAPLNKEARRVSAAMTGGTIEVRYSTTRELASGMEKAQLNIEVDNKLGDKDLGGSSKGEAGLTNFIIAETLSEIGQVSRRAGYVWFDEVLPHQDAKVCHNIYAYLKEKAQKAGIPIFLVDHNPIAANYADRVLIVEKTGNADQCESTISWR